MSAILEERIFPKGLNTDDDLRNIPQGDYLLPTLNIKISDVDSPNSIGLVKNVMGNVLVSFTLPAGNNVCIHSMPNKDTQQVYYFVFNSLGNHGIYRFTQPNVIETIFQDPILEFDLNHLINHANLVDGKLLYWTDGFKPQRKINVEKALENKNRKVNVYFGKQSATGETYTFTAKLNGSTIWTWLTPPLLTTPPTSVSPKDAFGVAQYIATHLPANAPFSAEACAAVLEITFNNIGVYTLEVTSSKPDQVIVVADNFYPKPYPESFIDRLKYPKPKEPTTAFGLNLSVSTNLVQNRVFQFAVQYIYDDNEKTTLSPYSIIASSNSECVFAKENFITIDFTDVRLNDPISRSLFKYVNLLFREHNDGKWKLIEQLLPENWGININTYDFYNNGIYKVLSDTEASTLFTNMPRLAGAQEFIGQKLLDADITEGFDPVCVNAELNVDYAVPSKINGVTLSGSVLILSPSYADPIGIKKQPIMNIDSMVSVFGGIMADFNVPTPPIPASDNHILNIDTRYFQSAPLHGFVFYLAGTDYYGVSRQQPTGLSFQDSVTGVINVGSPQQFTETWKYMVLSGFNSKWEIKDVQPGVYALRIASHLTTQADLSDPARPYQKTSTTVMTHVPPGYAPFGNGGVVGQAKTEAIIEVLATGTVNVRDPDTYAIKFTSGGNLPETTIQDISLCNPNTNATELDQAAVAMGYLVDGETLPAPSTRADMLGKERVTRALVTATFAGLNKTARTDHNGFYFISSENISGGTSGIQQWRNSKIENFVTITEPSSTGIPIYSYASFPTIISEGTSTPIPNQTMFALFGIYYYNNSILTTNGRTFIDGNIKDTSGKDMAGVNVVMPYRSSTHTGSDGKYSLSFYDYLSGNNGIILASSQSQSCNITVSPLPQIITNLKIGGSFYNNTNHYLATLLTVLVNIFFNTNAFKRGWDGALGLVYYDRGLRSGATNTGEKLGLHINFYTEPDANGNIPNTGQASVSWKIKHLPPDWATHYQWVRTKNMQASNYLQFLANKVAYTTKIDSTSASNTSYSLGTYVRVNLDNIQLYYDQNASSLVSYTWTVGDRIRFIRDSNGNYFKSYLDFEIANFDPASNELFFLKEFALPEIFAGAFFEIYTPRPSTLEKIYFEFGETFRVLRNAQGIPYHEGLTTDQNPSNPVNQPATGTFRNGDAWYRIRIIPYTPSSTIVVDTAELIEDPSISDFYLSNDQSIGRINIEDRNAAEIHREKSMRWSLDYIQNTKINDLSWFQASDEITLQKGDGAVNKLQVAGRNVLAIQPSHVSTLYIYESQFLDASGVPNIIKSNSFIGTVNPLKTLVGTINPESIKEWEGEVYGYDPIKGVVWRYAQDGIDIISDYKLISFFVSKTKEIQGQNVRAFGYIDPASQEYGLTFTGNNPQTIIFCDQEGSKRWTSPMSFLGENYSYSGMDVVAFKNGGLWIQGINPIRNNFFGQQYVSKITIVSNKDSNLLRDFIDMVVDGSDVWWCPDSGDIAIPASSAYPQGMSSRLLKNKFRRVGTDWYSPFMKDLNTPNKLNPLINGRDLTGHVIKVTLTNDSTEEVSLKSVGIRYLINEFTKK